MVREHDGVLLINPGAIAPPNYTSRQVLQSVALLYLRDDGRPFVVHVDLATPDQAFTPRVDWPAGFGAAHDRVTASILAPDLTADWARVWNEVLPLAPEQCRVALLRAARRCWSGERTRFGRADVLAELRAEPALSEALRTRLEAALLAGGPAAV